MQELQLTTPRSALCQILSVARCWQKLPFIYTIATALEAPPVFLWTGGPKQSMGLPELCKNKHYYYY